MVEGGVEFGGSYLCGLADVAALTPEFGQAGEGGEVSFYDAGDEGPGAFAVLLEAGGGAVAAAHGHEVIKVSNGGGEEGEDEARGGEVLDDEKEAVAFNEVGFEAGGAAGGMGIAVVDDRGGNVATGPTGPAGAEAEIRVFAIEEEIVVEAAGGGEHGLTV